MARKRFSAGQFILKLLGAKELLVQGQTVWQVSRAPVVTKLAYVRLRREFGRHAGYSVGLNRHLSSSSGEADAAAQSFVSGHLSLSGAFLHSYNGVSFITLEGV